MDGKTLEGKTSGAVGRRVGTHGESFRSQAYDDDSGWRGTWEDEAGAALINQGIHGVDLLRWLAGPVAHVFGYTDDLRRDIEADDTTVDAVIADSSASDKQDFLCAERSWDPLVERLWTWCDPAVISAASAAAPKKAALTH